MKLSELISTTIPVLKPDDAASDVLQLMDEYKISHLPIVNNQEYIGLVSETDIYELDDDTLPVSNCHLSAPVPYVTDNQHIFEALATVTNKNLSLIPVLSAQNKNYLGAITEAQLLRGLAEATSASYAGGIIQIATNQTHYSPALIASVVESNDMKIKSMFATDMGNDLEVTIKLNGYDTSAVIQGLERHGYRIKSVYEGDGKYTDLMEERFGALMSYLNV